MPLSPRTLPSPGTRVELPRDARLGGGNLWRTALKHAKRPSQIQVVPALPTTSTGKLARFQLREAGATRP